MADFLTHLRQRKLVQWALAYLAAAWVVLQVLSLAAGSYHWPDAVMHIAFGVLAVGFVLVLVLAWYHGERGVQRINGVELLIIALVLVVGGGVLWQFSRSGAAPAMTNAVAPAPSTAPLAAKSLGAAAAAAFDPPTDSIVVLPFANLSGDSKQAYFSNGITEEITGVLGQNTGLTVIAWETASKYANGKQTPQQIGRALNVAHVLGGSIEHEGSEVRVSVELVSTVTGRQLWSAHYDDSFRNIFAVQDKITAAIAGQLKVKFAAMQTAPTRNPAAHELYLRGLAALHRFTAADTQVAEADFRQALSLDADYADAWAGLAHAYFSLADFGALSLEQARPKIHAAANKALALDPNNVGALIALGLADTGGNAAGARAEYEQALALDPSNADAHVGISMLVPLQQSQAQLHEAARLDPDNVIVQNELAVSYMDRADWPDMATTALAMNRLSPHQVDAAFYLAFAYVQMGRGEDAVKAFDLVQPTSPLDRQLLDAGRLTYQALLDPASRPKAVAALAALRHANIGPRAQGDLEQLALALGEKEMAIDLLSRVCTAAPIACTDLAINPEWAPLHGDPRFERLAKRYTTITRGPAPASPSSR